MLLYPDDFPVLRGEVRVAFLQHEEDVLRRFDRCWKPDPGSGSTGDIAPVKRNDDRPFVYLAALARRLFIHVSRPLTVAGHHLDAALVPARVQAMGIYGLIIYFGALAGGMKGHFVRNMEGDMTESQRYLDQDKKPELKESTRSETYRWMKEIRTLWNTTIKLLNPSIVERPRKQ